jgi:hypothetical protein
LNQKDKAILELVDFKNQNEKFQKEKKLLQDQNLILDREMKELNNYMQTLK